MAGCNGPDRGCNITSRESALTSVRCSGAKLLSDSVEGSMREHRSRCLRPPLRRENLGMQCAGVSWTALVAQNPVRLWNA